MHESVETSLDKLCFCALQGLGCMTENKHNICFQVLRCSYFSGIPEGVNMLSVKRGVDTRSPCHIFAALKKSC